MTFEQAVDQAFMPAMCDLLEINSISFNNQLIDDAVASVVSKENLRLMRVVQVAPGEWVDRNDCSEVANFLP